MAGVHKVIVRQGFGEHLLLPSDTDEIPHLTAVNRQVAGSNPARGANQILLRIQVFFGFFRSLAVGTWSCREFRY